MSSLLKRIRGLIVEINDFNLGSCGPSDDPDKKTAYVFGYKDLIKRFLSSAKRLDSQELQLMIAKIDPDPYDIYDAYNLRADIQAVFDFLEDYTETTELREKSKISPTTANTLSNLIIDCLYSESANNLPMICASYGLSEGTISEAFSSKKNYVRSRILHFTPEEYLELAQKMQGKYPETQLDQVLKEIEDVDDLNVISKFDKIKESILAHIESSKYCIWVAVAWFTDNDLANALYRKSQNGINVQIIINNDTINSKLSQKLSKYFETFLVPKDDDRTKKLMHHKFCMIDFKTVIHGSYNWTIKANYNNETISIVENRETAEKFASEFISIKKTLIANNRT